MVVQVVTRSTTEVSCAGYRNTVTVRLGDLAVPPGNRLETLRGDRLGLHAIRINDQWRIVFRWEDDAVTGVEVTDYH